MVLLLPTCWVGDRWGLAKANIGVHIFAMASAVPMYASLVHSPNSIAVLFLAASVAPGIWMAGKTLQYSWMCELFPAEIRGSRFSLNYNLSAALGASTPFICSTFRSIPLFPGYYAAAVSGVSLAAFVVCLLLHQAHEANPRRLQVVHMRADPH